MAISAILAISVDDFPRARKRPGHGLSATGGCFGFFLNYGASVSASNILGLQRCRSPPPFSASNLKQGGSWGCPPKARYKRPRSTPIDTLVFLAFSFCNRQSRIFPHMLALQILTVLQGLEPPTMRFSANPNGNPQTSPKWLLVFCLCRRNWQGREGALGHRHLKGGQGDCLP